MYAYYTFLCANRDTTDDEEQDISPLTFTTNKKAVKDIITDSSSSSSDYKLRRKYTSGSDSDAIKQRLQNKNKNDNKRYLRSLAKQNSRKKIESENNSTDESTDTNDESSDDSSTFNTSSENNEQTSSSMSNSIDEESVISIADERRTKKQTIKEFCKQLDLKIYYKKFVNFGIDHSYQLLNLTV